MLFAPFSALCYIYESGHVNDNGTWPARTRIIIPVTFFRY